jgi:two-component system, chemotaxis family, sensor kinase CheA
MDTSEYMPMFLAEAQEHLQELNLAVVALEDDPTNQDTVDGIFRIAHSLKGMSATMGFSAIAELTHVMEDVFEVLRQREGGLHRDAITTVLACLDGLQAAVESIEQNGSEDLDPAALIEQLRALIRDRTPEQALERAGGAIIPDPDVVAAVRA